MRSFLHPLALLVLVAGALAALVTLARGEWSDRGPLIVAWTALGYALLVGFAWLVSRRSASSPSARPAETSAAASTAPEPPIAPASGHSASDHAARDDPHLPIQEALRRLNNPAALGDCALAFGLPHTIRAFGPPISDSPSETTALYRARGLRAALVAAIEELRSSGGDGPPQGDSLRYTILHEEYVLGRPNNQIMIRHSISESTFHRYRREAARLLGDELVRQEERLAGLELAPAIEPSS